jgi:hypothetical protein
MNRPSKEMWDDLPEMCVAIATEETGPPVTLPSLILR